jgi:hypothetical protein
MMAKDVSPRRLLRQATRARAVFRRRLFARCMTVPRDTRPKRCLYPPTPRVFGGRFWFRAGEAGGKHPVPCYSPFDVHSLAARTYLRLHLLVDDVPFCGSSQFTVNGGVVSGMMQIGE